MKRLSTKQHADILSAYLERMTPGALREIAEAAELSFQAMLSEPLEVQAKREQSQRLLVQSAVCRMQQHDFNMIQLTISDTLK